MSTSAHHDAPSSRIIENLIATYAFLVDDGEFAKLGDVSHHTARPGQRK